MEGSSARAALLCCSAPWYSTDYYRLTRDAAAVKQAYAAGNAGAIHAGRTVRFPNAQGQKLAALLDRPDGQIRAVALFAHCFTCGKSNRAARHIAEGLKLHGIAVLRFDFTGIGASEGEFANTTFSSNVDDLVAAADHLRRTLAAPEILIGHSLGGAAVLAAAHRVPGGEGSRHHRRAVRSRPRHRAVRREDRRDRRQGRSPGDARRAAVQGPPQLPGRHQPAKSPRTYRPPA